MCIDKVPRLFHFCDSRNIPLIREHGGIYSREQCQQRGIAIPVPGGDDASQRSDDARGTHKHVHLSFTSGHPMAHVAVRSGRIREVVHINIKPDVLRKPGVLFVPGMANTRDINFYSIEEACSRDMIDFEALYSWLPWRDPAVQARRQQVEKYEILVPDFIPIESIFYLPNG